MIKLLPIIVIFIVAIGILTGLSRQIYSALDSSKRLDEETERVTMMADENKRLKEELERAESEESLEETLRNDLNMGKPGETVVMIPGDVITKVVESQKPPPPPAKPPNWEGWVKLFIH